MMKEFFFGNSTNNDKDVVFNDQLYFAEFIQDNQNYDFDDWVLLRYNFFTHAMCSNPI